jgi:type VI secretion system protein ImpM
VDVGLFGKLPSHGDFLRRRTSEAFVRAWDGWLQECLIASRAALGDRWLDVYLTSPAWRFACAAGGAGPAPVIGLMVPSVDRVGRYFPLTVVAELAAGTNLIRAITEAAPFFESAEALVIDALAADRLDFEGFDGDVARLSAALDPDGVAPAVALDSSIAELLDEAAAPAWHIPMGTPRHLAPVLAEILWHRLSASQAPLTIWWTEGSAMVEPSCLFHKGLPAADSFRALLDGSWTEPRWRSIAADIESETPFVHLPVAPASLLRFRSAGATDPGRARPINEDAFVELPQVGLWAVADGLGGHADGEYASRMVCDALANFAPAGSFDDSIAAVRQRMDEVNEHLFRASTRSLLADRSASTVVTLLARNEDCAVLWAGDSRLYRWRAGRLERLTRDHSPAESGGGPLTERASNTVTRAVGVHATLTLDLQRNQARAGDRYLLCSDGLTRAVPEARILAVMASPDIQLAVSGLIKSALEAGGPDNVTVIVAEAYEEPSAGL